MIENIQWLGHGSFAITHPLKIFINPRRIASTTDKADVILISHDHYDHFSPADVMRLRDENTQIICNSRVARELGQCTVLRPWQSMTIGRTSIKAVPAYSPDDTRHPVEHEGLGFVISCNFYDIYYAGDTEIIPEMKQINPDISLLPIDGYGTLTVSDAVKVVKQMQPRWVIPYNWGSSVSGATRLDAQRFQREVGEVAQVVLTDANQWAAR
jgi:L-ascorbate metabolism protein UlaG (beta-lactamase superfamily)